MQNNAAMQDFVTDLLKDNTPSGYSYHNYAHTLFVQVKALEIAAAEHCTVKEMELISAAALWHDTGYINTYGGHEEESCRLAKKYLPGYGFAESDIDKICTMIMATKIPQTPRNKSAEVIADADLAYLGTGSAADGSQLLFEELKTQKPGLTIAEWNKVQIHFLESHRFFTKYGKERLEAVKQDYLDNLKIRML